jgi:hypothetical protein
MTKAHDRKHLQQRNQGSSVAKHQADILIAQFFFFTADDCFTLSNLEYCERLPEWEQLALPMYPGDSIIGPTGPNAFAMHNLAPRLTLHFCTPDEFTTIVILHP